MFSSFWSPLGVLAIAVALAAACTARRHVHHRGGAAAAVAAGAIGFQVVHALEHVLQAGYWLLHPGEAPWLTPWAADAAGALASFCSLVPTAGSSGVLGVETLHLLGNGIFFVGLLALADVARSRGASPPRAALVVQGAHVVEHVLLTATVAVGGTARGVTTAFGLAPWAPGTGAAVRVWAHFGINAVATALTLVAVSRLWSARAVSITTSRTFGVDAVLTSATVPTHPGVGPAQSGTIRP